MTPSQLKHKHEAAFPESKFFCRENMRFAGDTMRNYGCRYESVKGRILLSFLDPCRNDGEWFDVWELYRKKPVKNGLQESAYFDQTTFKRVYV